MYETMKIALIQMDCTLGDKKANMEHALLLAEDAVSHGSNLIVFPEMFSTGYHLDALSEDFHNLTETKENCPCVEQMRQFAKDKKVSVCGTIAYYHTNLSKKPNISCFYFNAEGECLAIYDKNHLFGQEKDFFEVGQSYPVIDTVFGKIGIMVCYDANFPEPARILACQGAEIIICPAAWRIEDIHLFDMIMPQRAAENVVYLCAVNRYGTDNGRYNPGHSQICSPEGELLAFSGAKEDIIYGELNASHISALRERIPYLQDLRPNEYTVFLRDSNPVK